MNQNTDKTKYAHLLSSESHLRWMKSCSMIDDYTIIDDCALIRRSKQRPSGYSIVRAVVEGVHNKDQEPERSIFNSRFKKGDYEDEGYHNEFVWLSKKEANQLKTGGRKRFHRIIGFAYKHQPFDVKQSSGSANQKIENKWLDPNFLFGSD